MIFILILFDLNYMIFKAANTNKNVDVIVSELSYTSKVPQQYVYDATSTPQVTSISPSILTVFGGELITVSGTNLPTSSPVVKFGDQMVAVVSSTSSKLVLKSPALKPGIYNLNIIGPLGNARLIF